MHIRYYKNRMAFMAIDKIKKLHFYKNMGEKRQKCRRIKIKSISLH